MDADLVAVLSEEKFLPAEALRRAVTHTETIAEPVLGLLETAADDPEALTDEESNLLFWGLHALAAARDTRLFAPLLRLLRQDDEALEPLLGDAITETLPLVLASSFDGDIEALRRFILDSTIDDFVRDGGFKALAFLTREGRIDRDVASSVLTRFDDARIAVEESPSWAFWEEAIAYLGLTDLAPRAEAARADGRLTDEVSDLAWFQRTLRQVTSDPPDFGAFRGSRYGYLDDPVAALAWTAETSERPVVNPFKNVGRNDPCPCGSGKKYKKCCLNAAPAAQPLPGLH